LNFFERYLCQFNIEGRVSSVKGQPQGDSIYCDSMKFDYTTRTPNVTTTLNVTWDETNLFENPRNIHVVIYKCKEMADNSEMCLTLPAKYGCEWCCLFNSCEAKELCKEPIPEIHSFSPRTGPWEGGTNVTIKGLHLGHKFSDISSGVKITGIDCKPYRELYIESREIVCFLEGPGSMAYRAGNIVVQVHDSSGESKEDFEFVDPIIHGFEPKFGPISGGTKIHMRGNHLNAGSLITASINGLKCEIIKTDVRNPVCRTSPAAFLSKGFLKIEFDLGERQLNSAPFEYVADPIIDYTTSGGSRQKILKGISSGGVKIKVYGQNFKSIQQPSMYVYYDQRQLISQCQVLNNNEMVCNSPVVDITSFITDRQTETILTSDISDHDANAVQLTSDKQFTDPAFRNKWLAGNTAIQLEYGFIMDNVIATHKTLRTLSRSTVF
jgi:plexin A